MAILDQGVNPTGHQIDAGHQGDRAVALVLMLAREGRVHARHRRQRIGLCRGNAPGVAAGIPQWTNCGGRESGLAGVQPTQAAVD
jgi:hypothetical protein